MKVRILYFAALREALGTGHETIETQACTVGDLRAQLCGRGGVWAERLAPGRNVRASVDHVMAAPDTALTDGAEVAFFPPVTGG